jgi:Arc/MetJ family transcription regulator
MRYTPGVAKRLIDIDEKALAAAQAELGTRTLKDTVNEALRRVAPARSSRVARALTTLARAKLRDRGEAWR